MKKLILMLVVLFLIYMGIELLFKFFGPGHHIEYQIASEEKTFSVEESYIARQPREKNSYFFRITTGETPYYFQTYESFSNQEQVVEDVKWVKVDQYTCVLPIFQKGKIIFDFLCYDGTEYAFYHALTGKSANLDQRISQLEIPSYSFDKFSLTVLGTGEIQDHIRYNKESLPAGQFVTIRGYKGIYILRNDTIRSFQMVELFGKDVYEQNLSTMVDHFYLVADYDAQYEFNRFYVVDVTDGKQKEITLRSAISFDSYIQGVVGQTAYLIDKNKKVQYEIDLRSFNVTEVGNVNSGIRFYNGSEFENRPMSEALNKELLFASELPLQPLPGFSQTIKQGGIESGFYYSMKNQANQTMIYQSYPKSESTPALLLTGMDISSIQYHNDYIYYYSGTILSYYHPTTGIVQVLNNTEYQFNRSLSYFIYNK